MLPNISGWDAFLLFFLPSLMFCSVTRRKPRPGGLRVRGIVGELIKNLFSAFMAVYNSDKEYMIFVKRGTPAH
jgi:hypothetical protein